MSEDDDLDLRVTRGEMGSAMMQMKMTISVELEEDPGM